MIWLAVIALYGSVGAVMYLLFGVYGLIPVVLWFCWALYQTIKETFG